MSSTSFSLHGGRGLDLQGFGSGFLETLPEGSLARAELGATHGRGNSWFGKSGSMVPTNLSCVTSLGRSAATNHVDQALKLEAVRNGGGHKGFGRVRRCLALCGLEWERGVPGGRTQTPLIIQVVTGREYGGNVVRGEIS